MLKFVMPDFCLVLELNLTDKCLDGVLNNNAYESEVLQVNQDTKRLLPLMMQNTNQKNAHPYIYACFCSSTRTT